MRWRQMLPPTSAPRPPRSSRSRIFLPSSPVAGKLLQPNQPSAVCVAFVQLLRDRRDLAVASMLLDAWPALAPASREAAVAVLTSRKEWVEPLLAAVEKQQIKPAELAPAARASLQRPSTDPALRERAARLFVASGSRQDAITRYAPVLTTHGDAAKGREVYRTICAVCHRKGEEGRDFGPNLATIGAWSAEQLLANILDPNREVAPNFMLYTLELERRPRAGRYHRRGKLNLRRHVENRRYSNRICARRNRRLKSTGTPSCPKRPEAAISVQQMADLIAFLRDAP